MGVELGNFDQLAIKSFADTEGNPCSYPQYLRSHGLFASRAFVYIMTTSSVSISSTPANQARIDEVQSEEETHLLSQPLVSESCPLLGVAGENDQVASYNYEEHSICIEYLNSKESSYSEVIVSVVSSSRADCYEITVYENPMIQEIPLHEYDPVENGFTIVGISKWQESTLVCFVQRNFDPANPDNPQACFEFPCAEGIGPGILHHPSQIWGYDKDELIIGVVTTFHDDMNSTIYSWFHNDEVFKELPGLCCISVTQPGKYYVKIHNSGNSLTSKAVWVRPLKIPEKSNNAATKSVSENVTTHKMAQIENGEVSSQLPQIEKSEVTFSSSDEIGRGAFGVVYRGEWSGTTVAVKVVNVRNAKRMRCVLESEVSVHCTIRHPNIVQLMAISLLKNSIYLISEFINGPNLEKVLFGDEDEIEQEVRDKILADKEQIGKEICQAVAYLHNLKVPIVHRDIKPANILVDKRSLISKLCDMGVSKLKKSCAATTTQVGKGVPGTPHYMAPECLVENRSATTQSDIWSLGCLLVELLTQEDCWQDQLDLENEIEVDTLLIKKKCPTALKKLNEYPSVAACFHYDPAKRPSGITLINAFKVVM